MNTNKVIWKILAAILVTLSLSVISPVCWSATYYVDATNGYDYNNGLSSSTAWKTIGKVNNSRFNHGDFILFKKQELWKEQLTVSSSGLPGEPITFGAYGTGELPEINGASSRDYAITTNGKSFLVIKELRLRLANVAGLFIAGRSSNIIVDNCEISDSYRFGVNNEYGQISSNVTIKDCTVNYNGMIGISLWDGANGWIIENNRIFNNAIIEKPAPDPYAFTAGVKLWSNNGDCKNHIIQYNEVAYNGVKKTGGKVSGNETGYGIWLDQANHSEGSENIVRYNDIHDNVRAGIYVEKESYAMVYYNLSYHNDSHGIMLSASTAEYNISNNKVYNNVCYGNGSYGIVSDGSLLKTGNHSLNNQVKNNISVGNAKSQFAAWHGGENDGINGNGNVYTYNCLGAEARGFVEWGEGITKNTYADWETVYGGATHSVESDPQFVDPANHNFALQPDSRCIDAGTDIGLSQDYAGTPVPQGFEVDLGAFEYKEDSDPPAPPTGITIR